MLKQNILLITILFGAWCTPGSFAQTIIKQKIPGYVPPRSIDYYRMQCVPKGTTGIAFAAGCTHLPCGIAISKGGRVALSEYGDNGTREQVQIWNSVSDFRTGKARAQVLSGLYTPEGLCFTPDEKLVVIETTGGKPGETGVRLYELMNGQYVTKKIGGANIFAQNIFNNPRGVVAVGNNTIIIANDGKGNLIGLDLLTGNYSESDKDGILKAQSAKSRCSLEPDKGRRYALLRRL